jgi:RNA polymerase sigma factor (sigma-70 family)
MSSARGDDFDGFFRAVYPGVLRTATRVADDRGVGEEAAIEAMTKAFVRWPRVRLLPHKEAWVLRVAINEVLRCRRRDRFRPVNLSGRRDIPGPADEVVTRLAVASAIAELPRRQRQAVGLRYLGDLSETDTAIALGVSRGALKSHLARARRSLRASLGDDIAKELLRADW